MNSRPLIAAVPFGTHKQLNRLMRREKFKESRARESFVCVRRRAHKEEML